MTTITSTTSLSSPALLMDDPISNNNVATASGAANSPVTKVIVHPLVLFHVLDHHTRRQSNTGRVIGTLLGRRDGTTVEVTNCFAVPHAESDHGDVAIGKEYHQMILALYLRANRKETLVGWYASAAQGDDPSSPLDLITDISALIHQFYDGEVDDGDPVHLVVDTRLLQDSITSRAYRHTPIVIQGEVVANKFDELPLTLEMSEPERIALHQMVTDSVEKENGGDNHKPQNDNTEREAPLLSSMEKLCSLLETTSDYVDSVVDGKIPPDAEVGRELTDVLATVPRIRPEVFDQLFNDSLQDLLMVTYLSNITRTQLVIAEKLNATLGV